MPPDDAGCDPPALRPQDWRQEQRSAGLRPAARPPRAESAAAQLIAAASAADPGDRLGSKEELRTRCQVSVGTFNEAVRIAQSRGVVSVRPGPGGGVFAAAQSPMVRLGNSVLALGADEAPVAEAVRIRDALDPLLIEDALWHASPADIAGLRGLLADMLLAVRRQDPAGFIQADWSLHARIASVSPHAVLRSLYRNLLDQIESHALAALPGSDPPPGESLASRHTRHAALVDALERRDREAALSLLTRHNRYRTARPISHRTTDRQPDERPLMDADQRRQFVRDHRTCVFGYSRRKHGPAMTIVYYVMDGDDILISTMEARGKAKAVQRDPQVSLCVLDEQWPVTYLQVYGTAVLERDADQAADILRRVVELMAGEPVPGERRAQIAELAREEQRVVLRVRPDSTFATPPRHVNQMEDLDTLSHWTSASLPW